jgi:predicted nucleic-acid-binding protein
MLYIIPIRDIIGFVHSAIREYGRRNATFSPLVYILEGEGVEIHEEVFFRTGKSPGGSGPPW